MDTPEKWDKTLDKMILAFEYILHDDWWIDNPKYDYTDGLHIKFEPCKDNKLHNLEQNECSFMDDEYTFKLLMFDKTCATTYVDIEEASDLLDMLVSVRLLSS